MDRLINDETVRLPISDAQDSVKYSFSEREEAVGFLGQLMVEYPSFNGHIFDVDPSSGQFFYAFKEEGPRMYEIEGTLTMPNTNVTVYVNANVGFMLSIKPSEAAKFGVHKIAEAGDEITGKYPKAMAIGELSWQ